VQFEFLIFSKKKLAALDILKNGRSRTVAIGTKSYDFIPWAIHVGRIVSYSRLFSSLSLSFPFSMDALDALDALKIDGCHG
jgi:hypothetical protein